MREFSVPPVVTIADTTTLTDAIWDNARVAPETVSFLRRTDPSSEQWSPITAAEFHADVVAVARGLIAAGVRAGDRVALMSRTRYEWTLIDYAIWAAGAVTVPIYETSSAEQASWILADSGAVAAFVETNAHELLVSGLRDDLPDLREVWQLDAGGLDAVRAGGERVPAEAVEERRRQARAGDLATIIYTSGTTGRPKGCELTHRNLLAEVLNAVVAFGHLFSGAESRTLLFLPLAHAFARLVQIGVVTARGTLAHTPDTRTLLPDLAAVKPTFLLSVPRVFEKVYTGAKQKAEAGGKGGIFARAEATAIAYSEALDSGGPGLMLRAQHAIFDRLVYNKLRDAMGGKCTDAVSGGAPLGGRLAHFFRGVGVVVMEGYGLTETSPAVAANVPSAIRIGTVGRPLPGVTLRIADDGEILVRGDIVFGAYRNNPDATREVLDSDGWFHTGDLGALDDDGYLSITGRKKEIIVTAGGKNVAPAVLEDRLRAHPLISQSVLVGDRQPFIAALITIDEEAWPGWLAANGRDAGSTVADLAGDPALRAEIQKAVDEANKAVSGAEAIKVFRILGRDFTEATGELTPSLKVKRGVVHKTYADDIAAIYTK
ncbi:AMP-dependent synthetase/ligase [Catenuloplanes atrovinosus]|uniref:Long-chain acyl-CoA synthetase n=1 Tax=Catenuloplanes atrovinosus TaxID=137266 RepID=A0AAE4CB30_9ACTN|nr:AMP-dependent synthetase/ligase [Catenuloplanes atrovinosus]MDR7278246.1 long-chain acyl-CoA synthetase [Catenuloplanes atrovinosus]